MDSDWGIRRVSTYRADSSLLLLGRLRLSTETFNWLVWKNGPGPGAQGCVHRHSTGVPIWDEAEKPESREGHKGMAEDILQGVRLRAVYGPTASMRASAGAAGHVHDHISKQAHDAPPRGMPLRASKA